MFFSFTVACAGVKKALYATEIESNEDPCSFSCTFNPFTGRLQAECRYDYCEVCVESVTPEIYNLPIL